MMQRKNKYTVVFLGTDGSGKSTIINEITPIIEKETGLKVRYEHMRPNYFPSLGVALGKRTKEEEMAYGPVVAPHATRPSGVVGSLFRLCYYLVDYTYGYFRKIYPSRDVVWIFDRYYYDLFIDQKRARLSMPQWIIDMLGKIVPDPDVIICLGGDPKVIFERKPETNLDEVTRQMNALKQLCKKKGNAHWIDTTTEVGTTVYAVLKAIRLR